jgi:YHS domain-containing protein
MNRFRLLQQVSLSLASLAAVTLAAAPALANHEGAPHETVSLVNVDKNGVILDGFDTVAFFTDSKPVPGSNAFQSTYQGAIYYFASAEHKAMFDKDPARYAPQFGAFCAYAVSVGRTAPIDVSTFSIVNGRLVVQHNARALGLWKQDVQGNLKKADKYWPAVAANGGKQIKIDQ